MEKKEAIKILKDFHDNLAVFSIRTALETLHPELKESEDERIMKALMQNLKERFGTKGKMGEGLDMTDVLAWFERQGEQVPIVLKFREGDVIEYKSKQWTIIGVDLDNHCYDLSSDECVDFDTAHYAFKLVEQKPIWSEEDEEMLENIIICADKDYFICKEHIDWLKSLKDRLQPKQEWSKEDEIALRDALWCCKQAASIAKDENDMGSVWYAERWLKSIKDKVVPQQKQEWCEEDEKKRTLLISILEVNHPNGYFKVNPANTLNMQAIHTEELVSWLKSLKDRYTWKPSDEQMNALRQVISGCSYDIEPLVEMEEQLKKLREE